MKDMFSRAYLRPVLIALGLQLTQQFTGINGVFFFLGDLFSSGGATQCSSDDARSAIMYSILGASINVVGTLVSLFITEMAGRRLLLSLSLVGMGSFLALAGCAVWFHMHLAVKAVAVFGYIFFFAVGCGPVPWIMMPEVMPSRIRGPAMSFGTLSNWLLYCHPLHSLQPQLAWHTSHFLRSSFIVVTITPTLANLGNSSTQSGPFAEFWIFAAVCGVSMKHF
jgi:hypothetical protein